MNKEEIRLLIEKEIKKTESLIVEYKELVKPIAPDEAIGRISRMDAAALRQAEEKLNKLKTVYTKVESPDFGICAQCKNPIPLGRILIKPESIYCVNCAR